MAESNRPRTAGRGDSKACAEGDCTFAPNEFREARQKERRGWEPCRGDTVLVYVRTGVKIRAIYVGRYENFLGDDWVWVIMAGTVRSQPRELVRQFKARDETPCTPSLLLSLGWARSQAS